MSPNKPELAVANLQPHEPLSGTVSRGSPAPRGSWTVEPLDNSSHAKVHGGFCLRQPRREVCRGVNWAARPRSTLSAGT